MRPVDRWFWALALRAGLTPEELLGMRAVDVLRRLQREAWS
jgi:hypothetical protein